jgi:hypothetical protein
MGFTDRILNRHLLEQNENNLDRTVEVLFLQQQQQQPPQESPLPPPQNSDQK